ncbi:signal peptide peptidase SppA [Saccharicrinis fermentans]|uniref:Protease 4 n=1 Tax=Saccharicrinis fermentans DSM 9555 = JCM 21142 TaxID=869213 RepID=W7Y6Z5_9BACT|nr:signal peptide peptidase SppA [Saccharicrinis fermentans]GAF03428.1 protease 4 [Saccharicrinis fermentans DSM 9555 = JCM 21142]
MAKFFKSLLLTVIGSIVTALFIILIFFGVIASIASSGEKETKIKEGTLLTIDLDKVIKDRSVDDPLSDLLGESPFSQSQLGLNDILKNIKKAQRDDKITGIYLKCGNPQTGYATLSEIRDELRAFKDSGKFIYAFSPMYSQKGYYLASVASKVYLPPHGMMELKGLSSQRTFFKGALEKIGVEMQIFKHGKFKSAVEPYMLDHMSEPSKEQTITYVNSIWNFIVSGISEARGVSTTEINLLADNGGMFSSNDVFVEGKLLDGLRYKDEVIAELKELTGTDEDEDIEQVNLADYKSVYVPRESKGLLKDKIAVIYAEGEIDGSDEDGINSEKLSKTIRDARRDKSIKAVVLRVNSPGGSGAGSDIIWREVKLCKEVKPVIVSMGDLAASGGYYIACVADTIVANPATLTGSIGVFGMMANVKPVANRWGFTFDGVKTNKYADVPSLTRPFTNDEKALFQGYVDRFYDVFKGRCADGRNTTKEAIDEIGQGRVWSGENAMDRNLVDVLGGLQTAIRIAKEKAGLESARIKEMPEMLSPIEEILKDMKSEAKAFMTESLLGVDYQKVQQLNSIKELHPIQARLPYELELN